MSQDTVSAATDQLLKILTMVIRAYDGHAECYLNWNVYDISVNCEFKMICMQKMNVIAKISCYFERSVLTLKLRKEYLNTVTYNTQSYSG